MCLCPTRGEAGHAGGRLYFVEGTAINSFIHSPPQPMVPQLSSSSSSSPACVCACLLAFLLLLLLLAALFLCEPLFSFLLPFTSLPFSHSTSHSFSQRDDSLYNHSIIHFTFSRRCCVFICSSLFKGGKKVLSLIQDLLRSEHCQLMQAFLCHFHRLLTVELYFLFHCLGECVSAESFVLNATRARVAIFSVHFFASRSLSQLCPCDARLFLSLFLLTTGAGD